MTTHEVQNAPEAPRNRIEGDLGDSAPSLSVDDYEVTIELFQAPGKTLLLESRQQVKARYAGYKQLRLNNLAGLPDAQEAERKIIDAEIDGVISAYDKVRALPAAKASVHRYRFLFRVPSVSDVQQAEIDASSPLPLPTRAANVSSEPSQVAADAPPGSEASRIDSKVDPEGHLPIRARSRFRQWLAARTLIATDYPGFYNGMINQYATDVRFYCLGRLSNAIGDAVMNGVGQRISFDVDALAFLETWGDAS